MAGDIRNYLVSKNEKKGEQKIAKGGKEVIVSEVFKKKNGFINPVIVTFQNGELNERQASKCKVSFTYNKNGSTNVEVLTTSGHAFKDSGFSDKWQRNKVIAIKNRKTNKVRLVEVDYSVLINAKLVSIPTQVSAVQPNTESEAEVRNLNRTFGAKKVKNRLMQREKLSLSAIPVADEVVKTVKDIKVEENYSFKSTETDSILHLLPPCHRNSTVLSKVYNIDEILTEAELEALKQEVNSVMEENNFSSKEFSPFIASSFSDVKNSPENIETKLAGLLFAEILIRFLKMPSKKIAIKKSVLCSFSSVIHEKLLNEFCIKTETSVTRPLAMRDKSLCYIIVISLICCSYQINLKLLATSTLTNFSRLSRLAQAVGAVPLSKEDGIFVLKLPLPALPKSKAKVKMNQP